MFFASAAPFFSGPKDENGTRFYTHLYTRFGAGSKLHAVFAGDPYSFRRRLFREAADVTSREPLVS
jgi:hypothetical protein